MSIEDEIREHAAEIEALRERLQILSVAAYVDIHGQNSDPVIVADLDTSKLQGYADRYFDMMFALMRMFGREVDFWEKQMFDAERDVNQLKPVSLSVFRATA